MADDPTVRRDRDQSEHDIERTDEFPILVPADFEDADPTIGAPGPEPDEERAADDARAARVEREIADLAARWRTVEALLGDSAATLADLRSELVGSRAALEQSRAAEAELRTALAAAMSESARLSRHADGGPGDRARIATLERALDAAQAALDEATERSASLERVAAVAREERDAALAAKTAAERAAADAARTGARAEDHGDRDATAAAGAEAEPGAAGIRDFRTAQSPLERIAELENYIAGRKDRWHALEADVVASGERIRELEQELVYRVERQAELESELNASIATGEALRREIERHRLVERESTQRRPDGAPPGKDMERSPDADGAAAQRLERLQSELSRLEAALEDAGSRPAAGPPPDTAPDAAAAEKKTLPASTVDGAPVRMALIGLTPGAKRRHDVVADETTIGRGAECDIRIVTHFVSRLHAVIRRDDGRIVIEDRDSTNGIFVNSVRVRESTLEDGDRVTIGETQFRVVVVGPSIR